MEEQDNNKEIQVILPEEETEEDKKKRKKRIIVLLIMMFVLVADLSGILAYFATMKDYHKGSQDTNYVIAEESVSIYHNLFSFIKNACNTDGHPIPTDIVAINFQDNKLLVSSKNDANEIYVTFNHTGDINSAIALFTDGVPSLSNYSVESTFTISDEKTVNCENYTMDGYRSGIVSKSLTDNYYISFTGLCSCGAYKSLVHADYVDSGVYENILSVNQDNKILYDLLYVILNGIEA